MTSIPMFSSVQSLSCVRLFATPWTAARQASLSITNSRSLPKFMSVKLVMSSSYLILCRPLLLLPPTPPSIRVFSSESTLHMRWPKYWSFSFSIIPSKEIPMSLWRTAWVNDKPAVSADAIYCDRLYLPLAYTNISILLTSSSFQRDYPQG